MTVSFTAANSSVSAKALDIITSALLEAQILAIGQDVPGNQATWGLEKLQRLIDQTNARQNLIYNVNFLRFTLQTNHSPHTIGPAGDFNVPLRPVNIVGATLILNSGGQEVDTPISIRNDQWWKANPVKNQSSTIATDLYYSPDIPLGNAYFWPKVTQVNDVRLEVWVNLTQAVALATSLGMPAGYWDWIITELAIQMLPGFGQEPSAALMRNNKQALDAILPNNSDPPIISTAGQGIPDGSHISRGRPDFNFLTGLRE